MGPNSFESAQKEFGKKFKDKSGHTWDDRSEPAKKGKYTFLERNYDDDEDEGTDKAVKQEADDKQVDSKLPRQTQRLMELIFNQNHFNAVLEQIGYNANKLPLGKLSKATLKQGFEHLHELASLIKHPKLAQNKYSISQAEVRRSSASGKLGIFVFLYYAPPLNDEPRTDLLLILQTNQAIEDFTNKYYSTIPHEFGRHRPPAINNNELLRKEISMLDTLTDMEVANTIMKSTGDKESDAESVNLLDKRFQDLGMEDMTPLDHDSSEYKALADYLIKSAGTSHGLRYRLEDIFRIERSGEAERFSKSQFAKLKKKDRRLLWHGSRTTNFGGILSQGLRIAPPEAPVNGYAFGKVGRSFCSANGTDLSVQGVYLADTSSKSAQYCASGMSGGTGLLLLIEAELGKPMYEIPTGDSNAQEEAKKRNCVSTLGVGRTAPQGWVDGKLIHDSLKGVELVCEIFLIAETSLGLI